MDAYKGVNKWSRALLENRNSNLIIYKKDDVSNARKFLSSLGKGDVNYEISNINYYENIFEELRKSSKELLEKDGVMYIKLMIGIGLAVCILLI